MARELEYRLARRTASINAHPLAASERKFHWPLGRRPDDRPAFYAGLIATGPIAVAALRLT